MERGLRAAVSNPPAHTRQNSPHLPPCIIGGTACVPSFRIRRIPPRVFRSEKTLFLSADIMNVSRLFPENANPVMHIGFLEVNV